MTYCWVVSAKQGWGLGLTAMDATGVCIVLYLMTMTIGTVTTASLLLREQTLQAGLRVHSGVAHIGLLLSLAFLAVYAWPRADHALSQWNLLGAYCMAAVSGVWFAIGRTVTLLREAEEARHGSRTPRRRVEEAAVPAVRGTCFGTGEAAVSAASPESATFLVTGRR